MHLCKEHLKAEDRLCLKRVKVRPHPRSVGLEDNLVPIVDEVYILFVKMCSIIYIYIFSVVEKGRDSILCITTLQTIKSIIDDCTMYACFLYIIAITAFFRGQKDWKQIDVEN